MSRSASTAKGSRWLSAHALAVFAFLYLPIAVLIVYSFNGQGVGGFPPRDWTLNWYRILFQDGPIWDSVFNSLVVAFGAMVIALAFGIPAALALDRAQFPGKALFPPTGSSSAHSARHHHRAVVTHALPRSGRETQPGNDPARPRHRPHFSCHDGSLRRIAEAQSRAGRSIARSRRQLLANFLAHHGAESQALHHRSSAADLHALHGRNRCELLSDRPDNTLPLEIWGRLRRGITPEINAISTIIFVFSLMAIVVWYRLRTRAEVTPEVGAELVETCADRL